MARLTTDEIAQALEGLTGWAYDGEALIKTLVFGDFAGAIAFMATARPHIDELNHHPEWTNVQDGQVNSDYLVVRCWSHDVGGVTERDFQLARLLDAIYEGL